MQLLPIIELCRFCPGLVTAMGVSMGLTAASIMSKGTIAQKEKWALPLLTLEKIGAWAITEPGSGSDAFGGMKATARRDGDGYVLNGNKTFITNGPYADTIVFICKLDEAGVAPRDRKILHFVLDRGMPGLTQSKPMRKMGLHSSPTGELFLQDVRVGKERLLGESEERAAKSGRAGAKDTFNMERSGVAAMALGIIERCLELSLDYARTRVQFGKPIGEFQLIQEKLARMEVARMNVQNMVFRHVELVAGGQGHEPGRGLRHEALLRPRRHRGGHGGGAALRRQRLHGRVPGGAAGPRRQGAPDLRRNRRDPDLADRTQPAGAVARGRTRGHGEGWRRSHCPCAGAPKPSTMEHRTSLASNRTPDLLIERMERPLGLPAPPRGDEYMAGLLRSGPQPAVGASRFGWILAIGLVLVALSVVARNRLEAAAPTPPGVYVPTAYQAPASFRGSPTSVARYERERAAALR